MLAVLENFKSKFEIRQNKNNPTTLYYYYFEIVRIIQITHNADNFYRNDKLLILIKLDFEIKFCLKIFLSKAFTLFCEGSHVPFSRILICELIPIEYHLL